MNSAYISLFVAVNLTFGSFLSANDKLILDSHVNVLNRVEQVQLLEDLAYAEKNNLQINTEEQELIKESLNTMHETIMQSDDLELISLFQRAVCNFNSSSSFKANPVAIYYKHYREPPFLIPKIDLILEVEEKEVKVTSTLSIHRNKRGFPLILNGVDHCVESVKINGEIIPRNQYIVTHHELVLLNTPEDDQFVIEIQSRFNPFINSSLEGMYLSGNWLTTQCESEGARKIFYTLDRPDVLSSITTTIIADGSKYPYRLSNGDLVNESFLEDGRKIITWHDPIPKPCYLFACVLGDFSVIKGSFTTMSGKPVELEVYVEKGKESRAHYSLEALKKAMDFDELFFDREYDLSCLKMVGIPNFNSGAMENKGLMIFNETALLVDSQSGTDAAFRRVAGVVGHEYFHNWSGNRVTIRNWFEIALKEAFTDWRAIRFVEWLFGEEFIRPKDVRALRELQFPEEAADNGHPIMVERYVDAHSIYDHTTYTKGREVFRAFQIYVDSLIPDGFREVLNNYFAKNDGKAVTFRELLSAADEVLARVGRDSAQFERWFLQQGTPIVSVEMKGPSEEGDVEFIVTQSCIHPKTGKNQDPFVIPFSLELLGERGVIAKKINHNLEDEKTFFHFSVNEKPTPVFMHGFSAPVILNYDYSMEDLSRIIKYTDDPFNRWDAGQKYALNLIEQLMASFEKDDKGEFKNAKDETHFSPLFNVYEEVLKSAALSPLAKAQLLYIPSIRSIAQKLDCYDFPRIAHIRSIFIKQLALQCRSILRELILNNPASGEYKPTSEQMQIRELRNACLSLLALIEEDGVQAFYELYQQANNFNDTMAAFYGCIFTENPFKELVIKNFYEKSKNDQAVFNYWLSAQASLPNCTPEKLTELVKVDGYDSKNPNHIRSVVLGFVSNLECYHDEDGKGYAYVVDKILEVGAFNPQLAHNYLAVPAFQDIEFLPPRQRDLMIKELSRLRTDAAPPQTRDLVEKLLVRYINQSSELKLNR